MNQETLEQLKAAIDSGDKDAAAKLLESLEEGVKPKTPAKKRGRPKKTETKAVTTKKRGRPKKTTSKTKVSKKKLQEKSPDEFPELPRYDPRKHGFVENLFVDNLEFGLYDEQTGELLLQDKKPPPRKKNDRIEYKPVKCRCIVCGRDSMVSPVLAPKGDQEFTCNKCYGRKKTR